jgi:hypothetical protein
MIVAAKSELVPALGPEPFSDSPRDGDPAAPVNEAVRHACLPFSNLYSNIMFRTVPTVMTITKIAILLEMDELFTRLKIKNPKAPAATRATDGTF